MIEITQKVRDGELDYNYFWICRYDRPDINKKPLRCIPPTKCIVRGNEDLPAGKVVYHSKSHFRPIGKNGNPISKIISPVDNTGNRSRAGNMLYTFKSEIECIESWNSQLELVMQKLEGRLDSYRKEIDNEIYNTRKLILF